jgi:hypothetical protein
MKDIKANMVALTINGIEYVPKSSVQQQPQGPTKIVILQRGWVMVGRFERNGSDCKLHNASVIRIWGTTEGLGQIAMSGPTQSTKLDKCGGLVEFDYLTMIASISCEESKWASVL